MSKQQIRRLIERQIREDGLTETGLRGLKLFRASASIPCAPAVYEPSIIAIVSGSKEAVLEGERFTYDSSQYLCCPMSMPIQAGTPAASPENPLYGVYISLDQRVMAQLAMEMDHAPNSIPAAKSEQARSGIRFAKWEDTFSDALLRLLKLLGSPTDMAILGEARMRELYYSVLKGEAGVFARQVFAAGNGIARSIAHVSSDLSSEISIDDMAAHAGMSRAVFHRKFRQVTAMSPLQFVKAMRLNSAAMRIGGGMTVSEAALDVGYVSASHFSRDFKRLYGQSPRQWGDAHQVPIGVA